MRSRSSLCPASRHTPPPFTPNQFSVRASVTAAAAARHTHRNRSLLTLRSLSLDIVPIPPGTVYTGDPPPVHVVRTAECPSVTYSYVSSRTVLLPTLLDGHHLFFSQLSAHRRKRSSADSRRVHLYCADRTSNATCPLLRTAFDHGDEDCTLLRRRRTQTEHMSKLLAFRHRTHR